MGTFPRPYTLMIEEIHIPAKYCRNYQIESLQCTSFYYHGVLGGGEELISSSYDMVTTSRSALLSGSSSIFCYFPKYEIMSIMSH